MKKITKRFVIAFMKIALLRMKLRFFLYTKQSNSRSISRKTVQKLISLNGNQKKNTVKIIDMEVDEI